MGVTYFLTIIPSNRSSSNITLYFGQLPRDLQIIRNSSFLLDRVTFINSYVLVPPVDTTQNFTADLTLNTSLPGFIPLIYTYQSLIANTSLIPFDVNSLHFPLPTNFTTKLERSIFSFNQPQVRKVTNSHTIYYRASNFKCL